MIDVNAEKLIPLSEVARRLGRHRDTVRAMALRGDLEAVRIGGRYYSSEEALQRAARPVGVRPAPAGPARRTAAQLRASRELDAAGW